MWFTPARRACSVLPSYYTCLVKNAASFTTVTWHLTPSLFSQCLRTAKSCDRTCPGCVTSHTEQRWHYPGDVLGRLLPLSPGVYCDTSARPPSSHHSPLSLSRCWGWEMGRVLLRVPAVCWSERRAAMGNVQPRDVVSDPSAPGMLPPIWAPRGAAFGVK